MDGDIRMRCKGVPVEVIFHVLLYYFDQVFMGCDL